MFVQKAPIIHICVTGIELDIYYLTKATFGGLIKFRHTIQTVMAIKAGDMNVKMDMDNQVKLDSYICSYD